MNSTLIKLEEKKQRLDKYKPLSFDLENNLLKIGELSKLTNETVSTIRHWTKEGLLTVSKFTPGGYQLYSQDLVETVNKIRQLQSIKRLTLSEIKKEFGN